MEELAVTQKSGPIPFPRAAESLATTAGNAVVENEINERRRAEETLARRVDEQSALYEFTERLQNARSLDDVYALALDAIIRALRCSRASVLLNDSAGVMRFVAWRDLSEPYRCAVEGHSPWAPDESNPHPICLPDIERANLPDVLKAAVRREGIAATAFIPLVENGQLLGKFMAYFDQPHVFSDAEVNVSLAIARQLGFAIARVRADAERKAAEGATVQLASIVESSDDAIISKNLDGVITTWNRGAERIFGYTADEAVGKPVTILIPPERLDEEPNILGRIRGGERIDHYETVRRRKDGSRIDISLTVSPMKDSHGVIIGASKIARDITERKEAEAKLRESERRLQELLAAIPAAIYTTDAEGKVTYYNESAVELAGRTPEIGRDQWCVTWKLFWPDGRPLPHDECPMAIAVKEGRPVRGVEAVAERPDGTRVPFIPYPTPLRDTAGNIVGGINMLVDISERKQAETQQTILLKELNHRVKNNMQMLQSLLYAAAHRTQNAEAKRVLAEATGRIAAMAAAQRILYGTTNAMTCDAREFLDVVCQTAQQSLPENVDIDWQADAGELSNDTAVPLALIVNELLTNAAKHGVGERGRAAVRVHLRREADAFVLTVEDNGRGFDLQEVRTWSSGLRLVQGLARQLRGQFQVTRTPGTCASLRFS